MKITVLYNDFSFWVMLKFVQSNYFKKMKYKSAPNILSKMIDMFRISIIRWNLYYISDKVIFKYLLSTKANKGI